MFKKLIKQIHNLRIFLLSFIIVSTFYSIGLDPVDIGKYFSAKLTQAIGIGTSTTVPPNPFNSLAEQLRVKEEKLNQREAALEEREFSIGTISQKTLFFIMIFGIVILFILIMINFYLDFRNFRNRKKG